MKFVTMLVLAIIALVDPIRAQVNDAEAISILSDSAKVLESKRKFEDAINIYKKIINEFSNTEDFKIQLARALSWNGQFDSSIAVYHDVLRQNPSSFDAMAGLASVVSWKGDYAGSLRIYGELLAHHPANIDLLVAVSRVFLWSGKKDSAVAYSKKALSIDPSNKAALLIISQAFAEEMDFKSSRLYLNRLLKVDPENETGINLLRSVEGEYLNKTTFGVYNENFGPSNTYSNTIAFVRYERRISYSSQIFAEADSRRIFGSNDFAGIVGGSYNLSDNLSCNGEFLLGPKSSTAQRERGTIEASYGFLSHFVGTATYQYFEFRGSSINMLSPAFTYYYSPLDWMSVRVYFGKSNSGSSSTSEVAMTEFGVVKDISLRLGLFHGAELYRLFSQSILTETATGGTASLKYRLAGSYGIQADFNYSKWNSSPWNWSYAGALSLKYFW